jgi:hypothetical protein
VKEYIFLNVVMLNVLMLNVLMLNVLMLSVVMLNAMAPLDLGHNRIFQPLPSNNRLGRK